MAERNIKAETPLHIAVKKGMWQFIRIVAQHPSAFQFIEANAVSPNGKTLLQLAEDDNACARWLLYARVEQLNSENVSLRACLPRDTGKQPASSNASNNPSGRSARYGARADGPFIVGGDGAAAAALRVPTRESNTITAKDELSKRVKELEGKVEAYRSMFTCVVCMAAHVAVAFAPCGHVSTCEECASQLGTCPLCRQTVKTRLRVYVQTS